MSLQDFPCKNYRHSRYILKWLNDAEGDISEQIKIDPEKLSRRLIEWIGAQVRGELKKRGAAVGISGGIDSSVVVSLCVRALGNERVLGVIMPDRDSTPDSRRLAEALASDLGIETVVEDITPALEGLGCYRLRDEAIRRVFPDFQPHFRAKITIAANVLEQESLNYFKLTVQSPDGLSRSARMNLSEYLQIVAASNMKQRTRMTKLYYHAERLNRAVVGTANKDEHALGFFVKYGDGGVDLRPIVNLYKLQIYQLAECLAIRPEIVARVPTADTYSAEVTQTDFFFGVDFEVLDRVWTTMENELPLDSLTSELKITSEQIQRVWGDILQKQRSTEFLRKPPLEFIP